MSKNTQENYLDELLYSVSGEKTKEQLEMLSLKSQLEKMKNGDEKSWEPSSFAEDDFLREFEEQLESENFGEYVRDFERELEAEEAASQELDPMEETAETNSRMTVAGRRNIPEEEPKTASSGADSQVRGKKGKKSRTLTLEPEVLNLEEQNRNTLNNLRDSREEEPQIYDFSEISRVSAEEQKSPAAGQREEISQADMGDFGEIIGEINEEQKNADAMEGLEQSQELMEEIDLSGNQDADLMDLLAGDSKLHDLRDMLSGREELEEQEDSIEQFADQEMSRQEIERGNPEIEINIGESKKTKKNKRKKSKKKKMGNKEENKGFFAKLSESLFGKEEEVPMEAEAGFSEQEFIDTNRNGNEAIELTEENQKILQELDEAEAREREKQNQSNKKKKKKAKPKKAKPKKAPKKPKQKVKKPPKPKKPKPVDNTPPLPKAPVILIVLMVASLMALVLLGTKSAGYQSALVEAKGYYYSGNYSDAFQSLKGKSISKKDNQLYNQIVILAAVSSEYEDYEIFSKYEKEEMALDSLICAAGRYEINYPDAESYECAEEMEKLRSKVESALSEHYQMTFEEALEIYGLKDREEYSLALHTKLEELGLE